MKASIEKRPQADSINIVPESREELLELCKLWANNAVYFMKMDCILHKDGNSEHDIANSHFSILIARRKP